MSSEALKLLNHLEALITKVQYTVASVKASIIEEDLEEEEMIDLENTSGEEDEVAEEEEDEEEDGDYESESNSEDEESDEPMPYYHDD